MQLIRKREYLSSGQSVRVDCDMACGVMLMDDRSFARYLDGGEFNSHGGYYARFPVRVRPPKAGFWNVVVDPGRKRGARPSISVVDPSR